MPPLLSLLKHHQGQCDRGGEEEAEMLYNKRQNEEERE